MHYSYSLDIQTSNLKSNPVAIDTKIKTGIIRRVQFVFPPGCANMVRCAVYDGATQILPTNVDGFYTGDSFATDASLYYDLALGDGRIWIYGWTIGSEYAHDVSCLIDVQGIEELALEIVLNRLYDALERLIDFMKGWL